MKITTKIRYEVSFDHHQFNIFTAARLRIKSNPILVSRKKPPARKLPVFIYFICSIITWRNERDRKRGQSDDQFLSLTAATFLSVRWMHLPPLLHCQQYKHIPLTKFLFKYFQDLHFYVLHDELFEYFSGCGPIQSQRQ